MQAELEAIHKFFTPEQISENMARTDAGALICYNVPITRAGRFLYGKDEIRGVDFPPNFPDEFYVLKPDEELAKPETIASFNGIAITIGHKGILSADDLGRYQVGHLTNSRYDPENLAIVSDLVVTNAKAIDSILNEGLREVSCGYKYRLSIVGTDLVQSDIRGNHLALVMDGRCGPECSIQDSARGKKKMSIFNLFKKMSKDEVSQLKDEFDLAASSQDECTPDTQEGADMEKEVEVKEEVTKGNPEKEEVSLKDLMMGMKESMDGMAGTVSGLDERMGKMEARMDGYEMKGEDPGKHGTQDEEKKDEHAEDAARPNQEIISLAESLAPGIDINQPVQEVMDQALSTAYQGEHFEFIASRMGNHMSIDDLQPNVRKQLFFAASDNAKKQNNGKIRGILTGSQDSGKKKEVNRNHSGMTNKQHNEIAAKRWADK